MQIVDEPVTVKVTRTITENFEYEIPRCEVGEVTAIEVLVQETKGLTSSRKC